MTTDTKYAKHAAESGHWYDQTGQQIEGVPYAASNKAKAGQLKKPTLRDARKHQWCRGCTSIIGKAEKPQLVDWKVRQAIMAALNIDRNIAAESGVEARPHYQDKDYIQTIAKTADEIGKDAAAAGTDIHGAVERHYRKEEVTVFERPYVQAVTDCIQSVCGDQEWLTERGVASVYGYGATIDLHSNEWLLDFKSKDGDESDLIQMSVYESYWMQLAACRLALGERAEHMRCGLIYPSRTHPGVAVFKTVTEDQLARGLEMFLGLLRYTFALDNYRPSWAEEIPA